MKIRVSPIRLLLPVFLAMLCSTLSLASQPFLTPEQKAEDFEVLFETISENYPFLDVKARLMGVRWSDRRDEFKGWVENSKTDLEYYSALSKIVATLQNGHSQIISPDRLDQYSAPGVWGPVFSKDVLAKYSRWKEIISSKPMRQSFAAEYVAGDYWVVSADQAIGDRLPVGAKILSVNGMDVHSYVRNSANAVLMTDTVRNRLYSLYLPTAATDEIAVEFEYGGSRKGVAIPARVPAAEMGSPSLLNAPNIVTAIIEKDKTAYLRIKSFGMDKAKQDGPELQKFFQSVKDYPKLIVDIRGNGGGDDAYWKKLLAPFLVTHHIEMKYYVAFRSGELAQKAVRNAVGMGYYFIRRPKGDLANLPSAPKEVLGPQFADPLRLSHRIAPDKGAAFHGKIYLLVDDRVYSSAETFASFAKATGFATLAGTRTGGDGIGLMPALFSLPNSGLVVRIPCTMGINPDGSANEEAKTLPDIYVERNPGEYINSLQSAVDGGLAAAVPRPEFDSVLRAVLAEGLELNPMRAAEAPAITLAPVMNQGYGFQGGLQALWSGDLGDFAGSLLWDTALNGPGFSFGSRKYMLDGFSLFHTMLWQPWPSDEGTNKLIFKQEGGIRLRDEDNGGNVSVSIRQTPPELTRPYSLNAKYTGVMSASRVYRFPSAAVSLGGVVSHELGSGGLALSASGMVNRRLVPGMSIVFEADSGWSNRPEQFTLDGFQGQYSVRGTDSDSYGNIVGRGSISVRKLIPLPAKVSSWVRNAWAGPFMDYGILYGPRPGGKGDALSAGLAANIEVGPAGNGMTMRMGYAIPVKPGGAPRWYGYFLVNSW